MHRRLFASLFCFVSLGLAVAPAPARAQSGRAEITGEVRDASGAVLAGARVSATALGTNQTVTVLTGASGTFNIPALQPGAYRLTAGASGLRAAVREGLTLATGERVRVDLVLSVGAAEEALTVVADVPLLQSETTSLGQVVSNRADPRAAAQRPQLPPAGGARARRRAAAGSPLPAPQRRAAAGQRVPVRRHLGAAAGAGDGAVLPGDRRHPGVQGRHQHARPRSSAGSTAASSTSPRAPARTSSTAPPSVPAPRGPERAQPVRPGHRARSRQAGFRRHQFGFVLGGPIAQDRTFFFADYQGTRQSIGRVRISTVPTALQRQGIFTEAVGGRVPVIYDPPTTARTPAARGERRSRATRFLRPLDPVARALLDRYPLPTLAGTANNYRRVGNETHRPGPVRRAPRPSLASGNDRLFARFSFFRESPTR